MILEPSSIGVTAAPDFTFITNVNSSNPEEGSAVENNEVVIGIPIRVEVNMTVNGFVFLTSFLSPASLLIPLPSLSVHSPCLGVDEKRT